MAKKPDPKKATLARIKRTEAYAEKIRKMFAETVNEILALNKTLPTLDTGVMYSFDGDTKKMQQRVEALLRRLHSAATLAIQQGVTLEWAEANAECDKLVSSVFGKKFLSTPQFKAWTARNGSARQAFLNRSEKGLNLSERVWKSVQQLREEMEVAMTISIGEGVSAQSMSRKVREYLNDPDLMFRRFRYKDPETGEWRRKWKKRIKDPATGRYKWIDYDRDSYRTGSGVYKSSAKNAMRVTRTETNIAYRRADQARWEDMDFVIGMRISLSGDHPKKDICDKLAGDYPKDFKFDGWHPQCFCVMTPITLPPEETADITKIMLEGGDWRKAMRDKIRGREIKTYPENFQSWVRDNADNIAAARDRGTEPYFIRNNAAVIDRILDPQAESLSTPDNGVVEGLNPQRVEATANNVLSTAERRGFTSLGISTDDLQAAIKDGDPEKIKEQSRLLALAMSTKQKVIKATASRVSKVAADYGETDTSKLEAALASGDIVKINSETRALASSISQIKREEMALSAMLPNAHDWHKKFTLADIQAAVNGVKTRMARETFSDAAAKKRWLESEIKWVEDKKKYPTWQVAQDAYKHELKKVEREAEVEIIKKSVEAAILYAKTSSKDPVLKALVLDMEASLKDPSVDLPALRIKVTALNKKYQAEYAKVKQWLDLELSARVALDYASHSDDDKYKKLATEVQTLLNARTGTIANAKKKVEKLTEEYQKAIDKELREKYKTTPIETIDQLLVRLGDDAPQTLRELKDAISKFKYANADFVANESEINILMKKLFDDNDFGMDINASLLESVFEKGFLNTFQTGTSNGYHGSFKTSGSIETSHLRLRMAHKMFFPSTHGDITSDEYRGKQFARADYEKYGHLLDRDKYSAYTNNLTWYGDVQIRFKKSMVNTTWTFNDSLHNYGEYFQPSLTSDPRVQSFDDMCSKRPNSSNKWGSVSEWQREMGTSYVELQFHGKVTIDMVESMTFRKNPEEIISKELISKLLLKGIELWYIDKSKGIAVRYYPNTEK